MNNRERNDLDRHITGNYGEDQFRAIALWWSCSSGRIELQITEDQAANASHQGQCDDDVRALSCEPNIKKQLDALDPLLVTKELSEYGAWSDDELADHEQNLQRLLWIACNDIMEDLR